MRDSSACGSILCAGPDEHYRRLSQSLLDSQFEAVAGDVAPALLKFGLVGEHRAVHIRSGPGVIHRPAGLAAHLGDHYLVLVPRGEARLTIGGQHCSGSSGTIIAVDGNRGFELLLGESGEGIHAVDWLHIAASGLPEFRRPAGHIALNSGMLAQYISNQVKLIVSEALPDEPLAARAPLFNYVRRALKDYVATMGVGEPGGVRLLRRVRSFVDENVSHPYLGADLIAQEFRISRRKLYSMLSSHDVSLHDMIMAARLEAARRAIEAGGQKVTSVIQDHGFSSPSTFYRNYKRRFGRTPRAG